MSGTDFVFNVGKGAVAEKVRDGANVGILWLVAGGLQADATLKNHATISAMLAAGNTEATAVGYARKTVSSGAGSFTVTVDNTLEVVNVDLPDQTWTSVAAGNTVAKLVVYENVGGADSTRVPLTAHSFDVVTDGSTVTAQIAASGFYQAS